eukprot:541735_1
MHATCLRSIIGYYLLLLLSASCLKWEIGSIQLPTHLLKPAYVTIDENILYIFGGYDDVAGEFSYLIYKYNIQKNEWITLSIQTPTLIQCYTCTAVINHTLIYIFTEYINTVYIFDTTNETFINNTHISNASHSIKGQSLSVTNDLNQRYIYIMSYDYVSNHTYLQTYDSFTNTWSKSVTVPYLTYGYTSIVSYLNTIILFGGYYQQSTTTINSIVYHNTICKYKIIQQKWECYSNLTLSEKKYGSSTVIDYHHNLIYIIGGFGGGELFSNQVEIFDPITNTIHKDNTLPNIGGNNMMITVMDNKIIIFGGWQCHSNSSLAKKNYDSSTVIDYHNKTCVVVKTSLITNLISEQPTINPTIYPTTYPSVYPSAYPTIYPTTGASTNISKISNSLQNIEASNLNANENLKTVCIISASIIFTLLLFCIVYLLCFTAKRSKEIGQISMILFVKHASISFKISIIFCIIDSISDYIFATWLIQRAHNSSKSNITLIAWISLICGVVGLLLCFCWILVARKLYAKIPILIKKLMEYQQIKDRSLNMNLYTNIMKEIRIRKVDIDIFGLLIACLDITQVTIIIIISQFVIQQWTTISIISLFLCIISCSLKCLNIVVDIMGCNDESINIKIENQYENKPNNRVNNIIKEEEAAINKIYEEDSDIDDIGHVAYERHISIIRNNIDENDDISEHEDRNIIQIHRRNDIENKQQDINNIIQNAVVAMGITDDEKDESVHDTQNRHIFLNGEESHSFPDSYGNNDTSTYYTGNVYDL